MECYDLYVSVGDTCRPAYHLKENDLRNESYPLDWMTGYSLDTVIHLFKTKFNDFFIEIEEDNIEWNGEHRRIKDIKNNIMSIHHFSRDEQIKSAQKEFCQKMNKRFNNLENKLLNVEKVVLISYRSDPIEKLQIFLNEFSLLYPHLEIKLINIRNNTELEINLYNEEKYKLSNSLSIEEYHVNNTFDSITNERAGWQGNIGIWKKILENYYNVFNYENMQRIIDENKGLVIYGAGKRCTSLLDKFEKYNIQIKGIAVTDILKNPSMIRQYHVNVIEKYDKNSIIIISLADKSEAIKIKNALLSKEYYNLFFLNENLIIEKSF